MKEKIFAFLKKPKNSCLYLILSVYILLVFSKLIDASFLTRDNQYLAVVLLQMMVFLIPTYIYVKLKGKGYSKKMRITPPKLSSIPLILFASVFLICSCITVGILFGSVKYTVGNFTLYDTFISRNTGTAGNALYLILAYAILPAFCEEMIFRSVICTEYEKYGAVTASVLNAIYFSLLHFSPTQIPIYIISSFILTLVFYSTRSVFGPIAVHFIYNIYGIFLQAKISGFYSANRNKVLFLIILFFVLLLSAIFLFSELMRIYKKFAEENYQSSYRTDVPKLKDMGKVLLKEALNPISILCIVLYIVVIIIQ